MSLNDTISNLGATTYRANATDFATVLNQHAHAVVGDYGSGMPDAAWNAEQVRHQARALIGRTVVLSIAWSQESQARAGTAQQFTMGQLMVENDSQKPVFVTDGRWDYLGIPILTRHGSGNQLIVVDLDSLPAFTVTHDNGAPSFRGTVEWVISAEHFAGACYRQLKSGLVRVTKERDDAFKGRSDAAEACKRDVTEARNCGEQLRAELRTAAAANGVLKARITALEDKTGPNVGTTQRAIELDDRIVKLTTERDTFHRELQVLKASNAGGGEAGGGARGSTNSTAPFIGFCSATQMMTRFPDMYRSRVDDITAYYLSLIGSNNDAERFYPSRALTFSSAQRAIVSQDNVIDQSLYQQLEQRFDVMRRTMARHTAVDPYITASVDTLRRWCAVAPDIAIHIPPAEWATCAFKELGDKLLLALVLHDQVPGGKTPNLAKLQAIQAEAAAKLDDATEDQVLIAQLAESAQTVGRGRGGNRKRERGGGRDKNKDQSASNEQRGGGSAQRKSSQ
jgi:hypothetical protein